MPDTGQPSFAVIVPVYNEEAGVQAFVEAVGGVLRKLDVRCRLIVVDDGSRDASAGALARLATTWPELLVVTHPVNRGYGAALRTGVRQAARMGFTYALFMDSDRTNHPDDIPRFLAMMRQGHDVIKATRYRHGGRVVGVPRLRVWISRAGNVVARALFRLPVSDCTNGFRAVRVSLLEQLRLKEMRFAIIMEELYQLQFLTCGFAEIPVTLTDRAGEQRPTSFRYRPRVFYDYLKYPVKGFLGIRPRL